MSTIQLKDFASAEHSLNGQEYSFISQNDKTRKVDLDTLKKFIVGTGTLLTSDQSSIINAINELQQDILNQSGGTGVLQTEIDNIKKDYISKTKDLLNSYQVGTIETNLIPTVQALTDVYDLLNGMIITINSNIGDKSKLGTIDTTNLVNAINEINNGLKNIEIVTQELDNLIGGTFDVSTEGSLVDKIGNLKTMIETNKPIWDDKYTKAEIDNKISQLITNLDWKESVTTFSDLSTNYPSPQDGWTVNVKDTDITYRWSGSTWVAISANSIPLATSSVDGKMSKEDKTFLDIVRSLWVSVTSHINDTVKHITSTERTNWNDTNSKKHTHDNKNVIDGITSTLITAWNSAVTHISDTVKHITSAERTLWNTVSNKAEKSHTHTKSQITDMPTKVSQFTNDSGYITASDIDSSQNHTHTNKSTLDKISDTDLNRIRSRGVVAPETGTTIPAISGMSMTQAYNNGYPSNYGNIISLSGSGHGEIFVGWSGTSGANAPVYVRSKRDTGNADWSPWVQFYTSANPQPSTASATKATQDSDGNQINTTYVKKGTTWNELEGI